MAEREGFEPSDGLLHRKFSKLVVSASHPPLQILNLNTLYHEAYICKTTYRAVVDRWFKPSYTSLMFIVV